MKICSLEVIILDLDTTDHGLSPSLAVILIFCCCFLVVFFCCCYVWCLEDLLYYNPCTPINILQVIRLASTRVSKIYKIVGI